MTSVVYSPLCDVNFGAYLAYLVACDGCRVEHNGCGAGGVEPGTGSCCGVDFVSRVVAACRSFGGDFGVSSRAVVATAGVVASDGGSGVVVGSAGEQGKDAIAGVSGVLPGRVGGSVGGCGGDAGCSQTSGSSGAGTTAVVSVRGPNYARNAANRARKKKAVGRLGSPTTPKPFFLSEVDGDVVKQLNESRVKRFVAENELAEKRARLRIDNVAEDVVSKPRVAGWAKTIRGSDVGAVAPVTPPRSAPSVATISSVASVAAIVSRQQARVIMEGGKRVEEAADRRGYYSADFLEAMNRAEMNTLVEGMHPKVVDHIRTLRAEDIVANLERTGVARSLVAKVRSAARIP